MPRRLMLAGAILLLAAVGGWGVAHLRAEARERAIVMADPERLTGDAALRDAAIGIARPLFAAHCAQCHGAEGRGRPELGAPDLADGDYLYGTGTVADIEHVIRFGIRAGGKRSWNLASMPAYARARPYAAEPIPPLTPGELEDVTRFILGLGGRAVDAASANRGSALFEGKGGCFDCHGGDAGGDPSIGAPDLRDGIWLHGDGSHDAVRRTIAYGAAGMMPAFEDRLTAAETRSLAVYLAVLAHQTADKESPRP